MPRVLHGMRRVWTLSQHERVSEPHLYQVPCNRTYGAPAHFLRYVPNKSCEEQTSVAAMHILRGLRMMRSDVQKSPRLPHDLRAVHAAPTHQTPRSSVRSTSARRAQANSNQKAVTIEELPAGTMRWMQLSGHITDVCTFRQCYDMEVEHLNLLLLANARNTIESYFDANGQACIQ